ncbi:MAG TPA: hypothetical protein H9761_14025 [Candidatus Eisenbergiella merdavium]|uniref:Uncharacterized protein n=1 Tax=Candidatus Eisenbergiella merdavium TaxID=2838551 RepID=A0A9D2NJC5_9FIRM|nr:hypothetical protein [Candidatus Eisenbergiella merdavium]
MQVQLAEMIRKFLREKNLTQEQLDEATAALDKETAFWGAAPSWIWKG